MEIEYYNKISRKYRIMNALTVYINKVATERYEYGEVRVVSLKSIFA